MIADSAVTHVVCVPDPAFEAMVIQAVEAGAQDPAVAARAIEILRDTLYKAPPKHWRGPRVSGIYRCELAQVREERLAGEPELLPARAVFALQTGMFYHALLQARFPGEPMEGTVRTDFMEGHYDLLLDARDRLVEFKTAHVDDVFAIRLSGRPKNEHILQAGIYAHWLGASRATVCYVNKNGGFTRAQRATSEWKAFKASHPQASELVVALTFRPCPRLAAAADRKAARIREHVRAGTEPACQNPGHCWDCLHVDARLVARENCPAPEPVQATPGERVGRARVSGAWPR